MNLTPCSFATSTWPMAYGLWPIPTLPITSIIFRMSTQNLQTDWYLKYYHDAQKLLMQGWMMMINNSNSNSYNNMIITIIIMDKYQDLKGELKRIWSSSEVVVIHIV